MISSINDATPFREVSIPSGLLNGNLDFKISSRFDSQIGNI